MADEEEKHVPGINIFIFVSTVCILQIKNKLQ